MSSNAQSNNIFVGQKPVMNYVLAALTLFQGGTPEICVKARGRAINRAIDMVEIIRHRFMQNLAIRDIKIGTEQLASREGGTTNVSTIEISLKKI